MTTQSDIRSRFPQASASFLARNPQLSTTAKTTTTPVKSKTTTTEQHDPHDVTGSRHASKPRIRQDRGGLNSTEAAFKAHLEAKHAGASRKIIGSQNITIRLANGVRYTPDFNVTDRSGDALPEFFEVKGYMRDDAAVKLKVAAALYPQFIFFLVTKRAKKAGGGWDIQEVLP